MEKVKFFLVASLLAVCYHVFADSYKVVYVNSSEIKIGGKNAKVGIMFSDKDRIQWTDDQQAMKVLNVNTKRIVVLAAKALNKKKVSSLYEYLTSTKHLSTRGVSKRKTMEIWQIDSTLYLLDTLYVSRPKVNGKTVVATIVDDKGVSKTLPISKNGKSYVITKGAFQNSINRSHRFTIKEFDKDNNWEYVVYRNLVIEFLPMK